MLCSGRFIIPSLNIAHDLPQYIPGCFYCVCVKYGMWRRRRTAADSCAGLCLTRGSGACGALGGDFGELSHQVIFVF